MRMLILLNVKEVEDKHKVVVTTTLWASNHRP